MRMDVYASGSGTYLHKPWKEEAPAAIAGYTCGWRPTRMYRGHYCATNGLCMHQLGRSSQCLTSVSIRVRDPSSICMYSPMRGVYVHGIEGRHARCALRGLLQVQHQRRTTVEKSGVAQQSPALSVLLSYFHCCAFSPPKDRDKYFTSVRIEKSTVCRATYSVEPCRVYVDI